MLVAISLSQSVITKYFSSNNWLLCCGLMAYLAKSIVIRKSKIFNKQGSALLLTVLTLAFLLVLLSGLSLDRHLRYWVSSHRRDEMVSFYNAQSAYEQGEYLLIEFFTTHGFLENRASSFSLNQGDCRFQWTMKDEEIKLQGIGTYEKNYTLLQGRYLYSLSSAEIPLLLITEAISYPGNLLISPNILDKGFFLPISYTKLRISNGIAIDYLLHCNREQANTTFSANEIAAYNLLSESTPNYVCNEYVLSLLSSSLYTSTELQLDHIYLSEFNVVLDLRQAVENVEIPSIICSQTLEILAHPEQKIHCRGLLYTACLKVTQGTIIIEPSVNFSTWIESNNELLIPSNFQPKPQLILARKDFRFLPERAIGE
jgi:hypothetical protein